MKTKDNGAHASRLRLGIMDIVDHAKFKKAVRELLADPDSEMNQLGIKIKEDGHDNILYYQIGINYGDLVKYDNEERRLVYENIKPQVEYLAKMWPTRLSCDDDDIYRIERDDDDTLTLSYIVYFRFIYDVLSPKWIVTTSLLAAFSLCGIAAIAVLICKLFF